MKRKSFYPLFFPVLFLLFLSSCTSDDELWQTFAIVEVTDKFEQDDSFFITAETIAESTPRVTYTIDVQDSNVWSLIELNVQYEMNLTHDEENVGELSTIDYFPTGG
ncbi:hypothetical protein JOC54_000170 [Alkalihalobacillus xiaoxiensis]|uniref:Uncharacterized protein n=1 Tax=Shouchella xiaoxiensis TaxID=766895 RepID=A0ABS2SN42_9BACI|nr:hypothetical protein [Shouchella xiaoxiensis]MBM7836939.1 hypothetical protein [Shouchella xiaoxiensis]